jgi:hypothetical protein
MEPTVTYNDCECVPGHRCDCWDYRGSSDPEPEDDEVDSLLRDYFDARAAAIRTVVAHKASPPEYPGLALVPVPDIERLETFVELPRNRAGYSVGSSDPEAVGLDQLPEVAKALFREIPLCTGCDFDHGWDDHVRAIARDVLDGVDPRPGWAVTEAKARVTGMTDEWGRPLYVRDDGSSDPEVD